MTKYIGMIICEIRPKFPEKGTKEHEDFLKELDEEKDAPVAQPG